MGHRVLIIEDDEVLRDIYSLKFEMEGFDVATATDGQAGLEQVEQHQPQLIILDMLMPRLGGIEFLRRFRDQYPESPAIILVASNKSNTETVTAAKKLGAAEYIVKAQLTPEEIVHRARLHLDGPHATK